MGDGHHHAGESEQIFHDLSAGVGVEAGGDLVGDDEVVPAKRQPCDADALALPAREILAVLADEGVEAVGQGAHPVGEARHPDGVGKLSLGEVRAEADVAAEGVIEEIGCLGNVTYPLVEALTVDVPQLLAVEEDAAGIVWVVLEQQLCQCRLAAAAFAHEDGFFLPGDRQPDAAQHRCSGPGVGKAGVLALDVLEFTDGPACRDFFRAGHGCFQPLTDALRGSDLGPALGDLITGRDDEVRHAGGGGDGAHRQPPVESEKKAHQHDDGEDEVADERGVDHHGVEALLVGLLAVAGLPGSIPVAGSIGVLPQKAPDDLEPAQKLLELLGVARHLERKSVSGGFEPLIHLPGQDQRWHGHKQDGRQHHRADVKVHPQRTEHDAAPERDVEEGHIIAVVEGAQVGGQQGEIGCVALPLILGHRAAQHPLHDLSPHLLHGAAGEFCKGAAAQPFEKPAGEGDEEHQPHIAQCLLLALGVDKPLELEVFQRREKGYRRCKEREEHELHPVVSEVVVDRCLFHVQYPPQSTIKRDGSQERPLRLPFCGRSEGS